MPLYEYKCSACGASFDKLVRLAEVDGQFACPECGSVQTKRQISMFGWSGGSASVGGGSSCVPTGGGG